MEMTWMQWLQMVEIPVIGGLIGWIAKIRSDVEGKVSAVKQELVAHQLHVAQNYPTSAQVERIATRLETAIGKLDEKLDSISDHLLRGVQNARHHAD